MAVVGKTLGEVVAEADREGQGWTRLTGYELVMVTSEDARYLPVQRVDVDHERRKVYLHG